MLFGKLEEIWKLARNQLHSKDLNGVSKSYGVPERESSFSSRRSRRALSSREVAERQRTYQEIVLTMAMGGNAIQTRNRYTAQSGSILPGSYADDAEGMT